MSAPAPKRIGLVGARGYAGGLLARLIGARTDMQLVYAASRQLAGQPFAALDASLGDARTIATSEPEAAAAAVKAEGLDAVVLALPNGLAAPYVAAINAIAPATVLVDLSADYRDHPEWVYGLPEHDVAGRLAGARRIANPGCYATAAQIAAWPLRDVIAGPVSAFGVSGYSGAGTNPSPKNDAARLANSLMAYGLAGHGHEAEIARGLGHPVRFTPHVAGFFQGLSVTAHSPLSQPMSVAQVRARFEDAYTDAPLVEVVEDAPEIAPVAHTPLARVGGFAVGQAGDQTYVVTVCVLDNLWKGAASQAIQNLELAFGFAATDAHSIP